ncbi:hypothetical protein [Aquimarina algiphila]|uniref:hypothetical protein n=1 Tax=Aquimarina algiphila TaxID=2047982 RepID=UPI00232AEEFF|nr:hypothetical protein [Aquimarina algiphila]
MNRIDLSKKYRHPNILKDFISAYIQQKLIEDNFDWVKSFVKDGKLIGTGKIKPKGCKNTYDIIFEYDPNKKDRKENIFVRDEKIKFGKVPHLYNNNSLCLYHPSDFSPFIPFNFVDVVPWISKWLVTYELWLKYGVWLDKEFKH